MESRLIDARLIPAIVLVPALAWPACNGGTENLGDGEGGSAGAELTTTTAADSGGSGGSGHGETQSVTGTSTNGGTHTSTDSGSGGNGSGSGGNGSGGNGSGGTNPCDPLPPGCLPDSGPIGPGSSAGGNNGAGGGTLTGVGNNGAGGGYGSVGSNTGTNSGAGGSGGGTFTHAGATRIYQSSQVIPTLTHDAEQLYTGGYNLSAIPMPEGPASFLDTASSDTQVAVDDTHLYVCSAGSLYRMSKSGGGTQNFQGADVDAAYTCRAVGVDGTTVSAAWFNSATQALRVRRWAKSDRTAPEDGLELDDLSESYAAGPIANGALYYADRDADELLIGRIQLDDYADDPVLNIDAEFDSEYLAPLAVNNEALFYQSCEQTDRWCSLFKLPNGEDEPVPFEMFQRDSVIEALAPFGDGAFVSLADGVYSLLSPEADLASVWTHPGMVSYGPLVVVGGDLYLVSNPTYESGSMLWRMELLIEN